MKKLLARLICITLAATILALLPQNAHAAQETHNFDNGFCQSCGCYQPAVLNGDVYEISNAGQLYWFAEQAKENTAINGRLMQNIVVNEGELSASTDVFREWYPIGKYDGYSGTFDGNDMEISGLHIYGTDKFGAGLFYDISAGGIVKNVCISNIYFDLDYKETQDGASNVGGIAAYNHGTIESCSFEGYLEGYFYIGGIAGRNRGTINNCSATGTINSYRDYTGGIAGSNTGKITNCQNEANITGKDWYYSYQGKMYPSCYIGGIVGLNLEQGVVDAGHNHGKVGGCKDVGGIAGNNQGTVRSCSNNNDVWLYNDGLRESAMGGIVGRNEGGAITDCFNNGNINGFYNVGGIVGYHSGIDDGRIIVSCYTTGTVTGQSNVGNAVGYSVGSISNCFYLSDTETDTLDGTTAKTTEQFASGEVAWLLNGSTAAGDLVWFQTCGEGYPCFEGSIVYRNQSGGCTDANFTYEFENTPLVPITSHNYENGVCTFCGSEESQNNKPDVQLKFSGASLTLQHNLAINYKVDKAMFEDGGYTNPYVVFELNGVKTKVTSYTVSGDRYVFTFRNIAPNQMTDTICATLYATYEGIEYSSAVREYSVAEYCYSMLDLYASDEYSKLRTLLVDLLNYGAASQIYTDYKTDALVNASLTEDQVNWGTHAEPVLDTMLDTAYKTVDDPKAKWKGAGLHLQEAVSMRLKFTAESIDGLTIKIESGSSTWTISSEKFKEESAGVYYVYFTGLNAGQMRQGVLLTIYDGDTPVSNTVCYSIESYAYEKQNSTIAGLADLVKAMIRYGDSACAYVN